MAAKAKAKGAANADVKCDDRHCPFHGSLKARGQVFDGTIIGSKMQKTVKVEWPFTSFVPKFERYLKKRSRVAAHLPSCIAVKDGDRVRIAECRPISRTIKFVVMEKLM